MTGSRIMLLCNVALGQMCDTDQSDAQITAPPDGFDSMHGVKGTEKKTSFFQVNHLNAYLSHLDLCCLVKLCSHKSYLPRITSCAIYFLNLCEIIMIHLRLLMHFNHKGFQHKINLLTLLTVQMFSAFVFILWKVQNFSFQNDEFAIYNANQQCLRYQLEYSMPGEATTAKDLVAEYENQLVRKQRHRSAPLFSLYGKYKISPFRVMNLPSIMPTSSALNIW